MGFPVHPLGNLGLAGQHLNTLPGSDISNRYFAGTDKYNSTIFTRFFMFFGINNTLKTLNQFYPYEPIIKKSNQQYEKSYQSAVSTGLVITAASWFVIFNLARRGKVLPLLSQYGKFVKTHRIFRQYLYTLVAPTLLFTGLLNLKYLNHTEHLWATHARRMNKQITDDPVQSEYPKELKGVSWVGSWQTTFYELDDITKKRNNEVNIMLAPDYSQTQFQIRENAVASSEDEQSEQSD